MQFITCKEEAQRPDEGGLEALKVYTNIIHCIRKVFLSCLILF